MNVSSTKLQHLINLFIHRNGYHPNVNNPQTFNEKILRRKLTWDEKLPLLANKLKVKNHIKGLSEAKVIPTFGVGLKKLNILYPFMMKPTNLAGGKYNRIVTNDKEYKEALELYPPLVNMKYGADKGEWWYSLIPFEVIYEPLIEIQTEVKFFCFHGRVEFIYLLCDKEAKSWFTRDGEFLDMRCSIYNQGVKELPDIRNAIEIADQLSQGIDHVRVDLMLTENEIYFGEYTFAHRSGHLKWSDSNFDLRMGGYW